MILLCTSHYTKWAIHMPIFGVLYTEYIQCSDIRVLFLINNHESLFLIRQWINKGIGCCNLINNIWNSGWGKWSRCYQLISVHSTVVYNYVIQISSTNNHFKVERSRPVCMSRSKWSSNMYFTNIILSLPMKKELNLLNKTTTF